MSSPGTRRRMPGEERAEQLLVAAERLFSRLGYLATSIEDIARAAGVTRPIVYQRIGTKAQAYLAVAERIRSDLDGRLRAAALSVDDPHDRLRAALAAFFEYLEHEPDRWRLLYHSSAPPTEELAESGYDPRNGTLDLILELLDLHLDADEHLVLVAGNLLSGGVEQLGRWWLQHPEAPRDQLVADATAIYWNALSPYLAAQ